MYQNFSNIHQPNISITHDLTDTLETKIIFAIIMITLCLVTTVGNICVIYRYRKASMVGNLFIISLACADLIVGCFVMPMAGIYAVKKTWTMSLNVCQIWLAADYIASTASILNLLTLSLDRYWSITSPLKYLGKRTKSRALFMISMAWIISLLWIIPITGWSYFFNNGIRYVPDYICETEYNKNIFFKVSTAIFNFYIPLIAMICINTKVYLVIRKRYHSPILKYTSSPANNNYIQKYKVQGPYEIVNTHPIRSKSMYHVSKPTYNNSKQKTSSLHLIKKSKKQSITNSECSVKSNYHAENTIAQSGTMACISLKNNPSSVSANNSTLHKENINLQCHCNRQQHSLSSDSIENCKHASSIKLNQERSKILTANLKKNFMNKQEKAFKQLSAIVIGFTLCFLPYFIIFLIVALCDDCVSPQVYTLVVWLGYFNSTINPFLYALSNKRKLITEPNPMKISEQGMNGKKLLSMSSKGHNLAQSIHSKTNL